MSETREAVQLDRIKNNIEAAYIALEALGITVPEGATVDELAALINDAAAAHLDSVMDGRIVQTTGTATDKVMSQKAVTENFLKTANIAQEAGNSSVLVMSQEATTKLVEDALGTGGSTEYETVDSIEEMVDTSKQYVLSSTGTIWAYGETGEPKPLFTNYADPNSSEWMQDTRLNSTNTTSAPGMTTSNYIDTNAGDVVRVANFNLDANLGSSAVGAVSIYLQNNKDTCNSRQPTRSASFFIGETDGVYSFNGSAGYLRFCGVPTDGDSNVIITINEEIAYGSGEGWYDTGIKPENSTDGGNYVNLLVKVNENKAQINEVDKRVTALETGTETLTVPSFWADAVEACVAKIKALQVGKNCVTFPFFSDNHTRDGQAQYMGIMIAYIMRECSIPYCFYGGDAISSAVIADEAEMIAQDAAFDVAVSYIPEGRFCRAVGNHDGYWYDGTTKHSYTRAQVYELFLRAEGVAQNKHFGADGTYYYIDDIASKVRFVVLNTNAETIGAGSEIIDSVQLAWLTAEALKLDDGRGAVIISHAPISNHYHTNISNAAEVIAAVNDTGAEIIGWFSGHIHRDRIYTGVSVNDTDDTEGDAMGFTQVTITSDHTGIAYDDATKHTVANDDQSHAIDFVTINRSARTVNLTRLGIGNDREFTY